MSVKGKVSLRRLLVTGGGFLLVLSAIWFLLPRPELDRPGAGWSRKVTDRHGVLLHLSTAVDGRYRLWTSLKDVSPEWIEATLAKEDRWFRWHPGFNPFALIRAAWGSAAGHPAGGASTLTMQVARLRWDLETRTIAGKLQQIFRAIQLERHYSKDEILEAYFNHAPYGGNVEGAGAAALLWCGRDASQVTRREAIALSVIPQSPATRHPGFPRDAGRIAAAQSRLSEMLEDESTLRGDPLSASFTLLPPGPPPHEAPHFCRWLMRTTSANVVSSTLDLGFQQEIERGIEAHLQRTRERGISNACAILVHAPSREVLAYVGSAGYADRGILGMVDGLRALRSPGSAVKPFVYGLAMDQGLIHPHSLLTDGKMVFHDYNPENFEGEFMGPVHANEALVRSRNIPAVALSNRLGNGGLYQLLRSGGVDLPKPAGYYGLALTLGGFGISPVQLASLYAGLADDGLSRPLVFSETTAAAFSKTPMLSPQARFLVLDMLRGGEDLGVEYGFARTDPAVAWKTGTSHGFRDAWAVGVRGDYVLVVWLGNFNGRGNNALVARRCAAPLLFDLFARLHLPDKAVVPPPEGVRRVELCAASGDLPGPWCSQTTSGWFIPGISPISMCALHREILVDGRTNKRVARDDGRPDLRREVCEFWPPDLLDLFREAGLPRRSPPDPENGTDTLEGMDHGEAPKVISPLAGRSYQIDGSGNETGIPLKAEAAPGVGKLYWFCGEAFLGTSAPENVLAWKPVSGNHLLRVVDDHGRSAEASVRVGKN
ncbi:MAG: penicillin-binding protein 1C [Luteolibacter sp.]